MQPTVSIIIPSFNRALLIGETLDSIIAQSYPYWECIVIDDDSTDNSEAVVKSYCKKDSRIHYFKRPLSKPKGANACRNYGLELSNGKYINWIDSDDIMHRDKLKLQIALLEEDTNYFFSVCQSMVFLKAKENKIGLKSQHIISENPFEDFITKKIIIPIQAPVFRRSFILDHKFSFDESLKASQEWDLFSRILFYTRKYKTIEQPLDYIRQHGESISGERGKHQNWYYYLARYKIYNLYKAELSPECTNYFKRYFLLMFKLLLRQKAIEYAFKVWRMSLVVDRGYSIKQHTNMILALISFALFGKGDRFLTKVHRWNLHKDSFSLDL